MKHKQTFRRMAVGLLAGLACVAHLCAQTQQVSGTVVSTDNEPLIGVNVVVKGSGQGTITDIDGRFSLQNIPQNAILSISYIGYISQNVSVAGKSALKITLKEDAQNLDEVVVVGYGVQKKSDLTGSVGSVDNSALTGKGSTTVMESLQGQVAGVDISQSSSRVGESFSIQIRGQSSLQKDGCTPLYVVDGIVCDDINFLNPADIEKIDILKDASSTAIYGSRATNGVVMVTTKQAKLDDESRFSVTYDGFVGFKQVARMPEFMDDTEWMDYRYMKYTTPVKNGSGDYDIVNGRLTKTMTAGNLLSVWNDKGSNISTKMREQYQNKDFTNWRDLMLQNGTQQNHFVQASGGNKTTAYRIGFGYQQEDGIMGDGYNRFNLKVAADTKLGKMFSTGMSANLVSFNYEYGSKRAVQESFRANGYWLPYNTETGEVNYLPGKDLRPGQASSLTFPAGFSSSVSPLIDAANSDDQTKGYRVLANAYLQFQPIKEVILKTTLSPSLSTRRRGEYYGGLSSAQSSTYNATSAPDGVAKATVNNRRNFSYTWDTQANYIKSFGDHDVNFMALFSMYDTNYEKYELTGTGVTANTLWYNLGSASSYENASSEYNRESMLSYAMRANYGYKGKYLATASIRWDGSSKFQDGFKWDYFPSLALAWRISEEDFVKDNANWLNNLKLRVSYGVTGNNGAVGSYDTQALASKLYYSGFGKGFGPNGVVNEDLSWERTNEVNIGLDFAVLGGRLSGTVDWYNKISKDLLMEQKLLLEQGSPNGTMWANVGKVRNRGIEVLLKGILIQNKNVYWDLTATFAKNNNAIMELQGKKEDMRADRWFIGQPIDVLYDLKSTGICTQDRALETRTINGITKTNSEWYGWYEGCMTYEDLNNDGKISDDDRQIIGHTMPTWTGTLSTSLTVKGWDFSMSVNTKQGCTVLSPFMQEFTDYSDRGRTKLRMDFYIPEGSPIFNTYIDGSGVLQSDKDVVATSTHVGTYPYPVNDVNLNHGGGIGWRTGKNTTFDANSIVDASYVKIKNITVGYTFPKDWMKKIHFQSLRLYFNVLNPCTFTKYKGFDPEWATASISEGQGGPSSISYQIGLNVKL